MAPLPVPRPPGAPRGQAMAEYVVIVALALLSLAWTMGLFLDGVGDYYRNIQHVVCGPFP